MRLEGRCQQSSLQGRFVTHARVSFVTHARASFVTHGDGFGAAVGPGGADGAAEPSSHPRTAGSPLGGE